MRKLLFVLFVAIMFSTMTACGSSGQPDNSSNTAENGVAESKEETASLKDQIPGTWEIVDSNYSVSKMVLYKGGTGDGYDSTNTNGLKYSLSWTIEDDVVNISLDSSGQFVTGYSLEDGELVSVDGKYHYKRTE